MNFLVTRKLQFGCYDDLVSFLANYDIRILAVENVMVESMTEEFIEDNQTREDATFFFQINNAASLEAANTRLDDYLIYLAEQNML